MKSHAEALYTMDQDKMLKKVNEPWGSDTIAPRFFLGKSAQGEAIAYFRWDVQPDIREKLLTLSKAEPPVQGTELPRHFVDYLYLLDGGEYHQELCYYYATPLKPKRECVLLDDKNAGDYVKNQFIWIKEELPWAMPCAAFIADGNCVSLCRSVRITPKAHEAGIETLEEYRGNGYAQDVLDLWAAEVRKLGALPLYSTSADNVKSQRVAQKARLTYFGTSFTVQ